MRSIIKALATMQNSIRVKIKINHSEVELTVPHKEIEYNNTFQLRLEYIRDFFIVPTIQELKKENYDS